MIVNEAVQQFKVQVDKADSFNSANFLPEEIDLFLSDAVEEFIEQRAYGNNAKKLSIEETQKRVSDLQSITSNAIITPLASTTANKPNGQFVELPSDYRHALDEEITVTYVDCNNKTQSVRVPVKPLTHDRYNKMVQNPFLVPDNTRVYRLPYGRYNSKEHFEIILASTQTAVNYFLRYLKNPSKFNTAQRTISPATIPFGLNVDDTIELPDISMREVISIAVKNALGVIESTRTQEARLKVREIE